MQNKFYQYYYKQIDIISSTLLLYFSLVFILVPIFNFITNEYLHATIVLSLSFAFCSNKGIRVRFNELLHCIIRIRR